MIDNNTLHLMLRAFPMLTELPGELQQEIRRSGAIVRIEKNCLIFSPGDLCHSYPLVVKGEIRVFQADLDGRQITLYDLEPGELCVLSTGVLLSGTAYTAYAVARTDTVLVTIPQATFERMTSDSTAWRRRVFALYGERLSELTVLIDGIAFKNLDQRLAESLASAPSDVIEMTHQQIADDLGSVRVIITRLLGKFEERGWLKLDRGIVRICDRDSLAKIARR